MLIQTIVLVYQWRKLSEVSEILEDQHGRTIAKAEHNFAYVIVNTPYSKSTATYYYWKDLETNKRLIEQALINKGYTCI